MQAKLLPQFGSEDPGKGFCSYFRWLERTFSLEISITKLTDVTEVIEAFYHPGWRMYSLKYIGKYHVSISREMAIKELNKYILNEWEAEHAMFLQGYL